MQYRFAVNLRHSEWWLSNFLNKILSWMMHKSGRKLLKLKIFLCKMLSNLVQFVKFSMVLHAMNPILKEIYFCFPEQFIMIASQSFAVYSEGVLMYSFLFVCLCIKDFCIRLKPGFDSVLLPSRSFLRI